MNLRNASVYMGILALVVSVGLMLQFVVIEFRTSEYVTFSPESETYIDLMLISIEENNLETVPEKSNAEYQEDNIFLSDESSGTTSITDVLAQLNVFKGFVQKFINPFKFLFNVPSFLISMTGLPLEPFKPLTTIINLIIYIGLILMIIKELRG